MKAQTLDAFLTQCREAKSSDDIGAVVEQIEQKTATMRAERAGMEGQLQEAIVTGRDPGKIHTAIAQLDQDLMTLEAARGGFSQKQVDVRKIEEAAARQALRDRLAAEAQQVTEHGKKLRAATDDLWRLACEGEKAIRQHDRTAAQLEGLGERRLQRASALLRESIGVRLAPSAILNFSEYGKQVFTLLGQILSLNPANLLRARLSRRQAGRFGESYLARDHAVEAMMDQVRNARTG